MDRADLIAEFLNSLDARTFGEHADYPILDDFGTAEDLARWLRKRGRLRRNESVSPDDYRAALRLRNGLRDVLDTARTSQGAQTANAVARRFPLTVTFDEGTPRLGRDDLGTRAFLAEVLAACALADADGSWPLIKMCVADDCSWVFVDRSRNRMGRWCATEVCGNRVKTRRYRERQRASSGNGSPLERASRTASAQKSGG